MGDVAQLRVSAGRDRLHVDIYGGRGIGPADGRVFHGDQAGEDDQGGPEGGIGRLFRVGEQDLARLNDEHFHRTYAMSVQEALPACGRVVSMRAPTGPRHAPTRSSVSRTPGSAGSSTPISLPMESPPGAGSTDMPLATSQTSPAHVLDLCGTWSVAGLLAARLARPDGTPATRVLALVEGEEIALALNLLARENGLGRDRYLASPMCLDDLVARWVSARGSSDGPRRSVDWFQLVAGAESAGNGCDPGGQAASDVSHDYGPGWCMVLASIVEGSGLLRQGALGDLELCRRFLCRGDGGLGASFLPASLDVICRGLQRASLVAENHVGGGGCRSRCPGVDVTPVNAFGVSNFRELDLSRAAQAELLGTGGAAVPSRPSAAADAVDGSRRGEIYPPDGGDDEVFLTDECVCYELELGNIEMGPEGLLSRRSSVLRIARGGTLHAVAYWFRQRFGPSGGFTGQRSIDTGPRVGCDGDHGGPSHFRQAAIVLDEPMSVLEGQVVELDVFCTSSQGVVIQVTGISEGGEVGSMQGRTRPVKS